MFMPSTEAVTFGVRLAYVVRILVLQGKEAGNFTACYVSLWVPSYHCKERRETTCRSVSADGCSCELLNQEQTLPVLWVQPGHGTTVVYEVRR
jgi:hypothetical protein